MRQVRRDEIIWKITQGLRTTPEGPPCPIISEREGGQGIAGFEG
jgi:hypothetical protein